MEISEIEVIPIEIDLKKLGDGWGIGPYKTGVNYFEKYRRLLVKLETKEGITGWGETKLAPSTGVAKSFFEDVVKPDVVGRSVHDVEMIGGGRELGGRRNDVYDYQFFNFDAYRGGLDIAMWDAFGKSLNVPLYKLLGGKESDTIPIGFCLGITDLDDAVELTQRAYEHGFRTLKTKAGHNWRADAERLLRMHEAVSGEMDFRVDPNQSLNFEDAVRLGATLEDGGMYLQYFEQPVRVDSFGTYKRLRERLRQPIGVNEDAYHAHNIFNLLREDAIDCAVIDVVPAGGIFSAKRLAGIAADAGVSVAHHSTFDFGIKTAAVLHLHTSTPGINLPPDRVNYAHEDDIIEDRFQLQEGSFEVPEGPGLGITVDEEKVEQYRLD